jgi:hypothetical protein
MALVPRLYATPEKPKITSNSKVKILTQFVKHLSTLMCCKPASLIPTRNTPAGLTVKNYLNQAP